MVILMISLTFYMQWKMRLRIIHFERLGLMMGTIVFSAERDVGPPGIYSWPHS
jgi:hypothetical protein